MPPETPSPGLSGNKKPQRILFASSEVYPFMKTGGLADVSCNLPDALYQLGQDIRIIMPGYQDALTAAQAIASAPLTAVAHLQVQSHRVTLVETRLPPRNLTVWLVVTPLFSERSGNPYSTPHSKDWPDNAARFNLFCQVVSAVAQGEASLNWQADLVHCNDWQTGLTPVYLSQQKHRPATLFTIHNLAYQGLFPFPTFLELGLDPSLWHLDALEYHNQLSFIKGGLVFSDWINTVSPHYAEEIKTPDFGHGLDGLLRFRQHSLSGILNGINTEEWNPAHDKAIPSPYDQHSLEKKRLNKTDLQQAFGLKKNTSIPLLGWVGRLAEQKGIELLLKSLPALLKLPVQLIILGTGEPHYERLLVRWAKRHPDKMAALVGYDEALAHRIIAGADFFLMPSEFEPCGLTQMYSLRYGTLPIANRVGGLSDTIIGINRRSLNSDNATGMLMDKPNKTAFIAAIKDALTVFHKPSVYQSMQRNAMQRNFSWQLSAENYLIIYKRLIENNSTDVIQKQPLSGA